MATSLSTQIMRKLAGDAVIFNDALVDGRRSYKVWRWTENDYKLAQKELASRGLTSSIVVSPYKAPCSGRQIHRIHVG